jgi:hypothetical protein
MFTINSSIPTGQADFRKGYKTIDHIFTLQAIVEEARQRSLKIYCCFVDFQEAFHTVPNICSSRGSKILVFLIALLQQ